MAFLRTESEGNNNNGECEREIEWIHVVTRCGAFPTRHDNELDTKFRVNNKMRTNREFSHTHYFFFQLTVKILTTTKNTSKQSSRSEYYEVVSIERITH